LHLFCRETLVFNLPLTAAACLGSFTRCNYCVSKQTQMAATAKTQQQHISSGADRPQKRGFWMEITQEEM